MYQYPYGNAQQLNLDWLMEQWQEVKQSIDGSLQGEIDRVEAAITDLLAARDAAVAAAGAANTSAGAAAASAQAAAADAATATAQAAAATQERVNAAQAANNAQSYAGTAQTQAAAAQNAAGQAAASAVNAAASAAGALQNFQLSDAARQAAQAAEQDAEAAATLLQPPATSADIGKALIVKTVGGGTVTAYELGESGGGGGTPAIVNTIEDVPIASFDDGTVNPVQQLVVDIEPVQAGSGDPAPDNVRPITGWTDANVNVTGINAWDEEWEVGRIDTTTGNNVDSITQIRAKNYIPVKSGSSYYIHVSDAIWVMFYKHDKTIITSGLPNGSQVSGNARKFGATAADLIIAIPVDCCYIRFYCQSSYGTTYGNDISINCPSTDHDYHAYTGTTIPITFPTEAGTVYGATLENQGTDVWKLRVDKVSEDFDGSTDEGWTTSGTGSYVAKAPDMKRGTTPISSEYPMETSPNSGEYVIRPINNNIDYQTLADWKTHLAQAPLQVVYELATPVEYTFTTADVILLLAGYNNVWADTGNINLLQYYADSKKYIDEQDALIKALIAPVLDDMIADTALTANDFRIVDNTLYRITAPVAAGAALTPNTNCTATTIGAILKTLLT